MNGIFGAALVAKNEKSAPLQNSGGTTSTHHGIHRAGCLCRSSCANCRDSEHLRMLDGRDVDNV